MKLDDRRALEALDRHATHRVLAEFPSQCRRALDLASTPPAPATRPRLVIVAGMGGSASGGDMLAACAAETLDVLILVHRGYGLPAAARHDTLVLAVSYSGDTAEVLSATEFDLLKVFAENPNRPLARDWLLETVGHREMEVFDRAMDLRITRIRRKVEKDPAHPEAIRTVRGVGYMFVPPKD